jgi:hypothetical protein
MRITMYEGSYFEQGDYFSDWDREPQFKAIVDVQDRIRKDIYRTYFFRQQENDYKNLLIRWFSVGRSFYCQADMEGGCFPATIFSLSQRQYLRNPDHQEEENDYLRYANLGRVSFGYINAQGEVSGVFISFSTHPDLEKEWAMSILHNADEQPNKRRLHVLSNIDDALIEETFLTKNVKPLKKQSIELDNEAMGFWEILSTYIQSDAVMAYLKNVFSNEGQLNRDYKEALTDCGYIEEGLVIKLKLSEDSSENEELIVDDLGNDSVERLKTFATTEKDRLDHWYIWNGREKARKIDVALTSHFFKTPRLEARDNKVYKLSSQEIAGVSGLLAALGMHRYQSQEDKNIKTSSLERLEASFAEFRK